MLDALSRRFGALMEKRFGNSWVVRIETRNTGRSHDVVATIRPMRGRGEIQVTASFPMGADVSDGPMAEKSQSIFVTFSHNGALRDVIWRGKKFPMPRTTLKALDAKVPISQQEEAFGAQAVGVA
jgi:hypothetical protein